MLIGGASMTLVGIAVLLVEGRRSNVARGQADRETALARHARAIALTGGFMLGLSTFQAEFDFGVPQFRFVFQPMLIMLAAGVGLVAIRHVGGPRRRARRRRVLPPASAACSALIIGPVLGETTPHLPLYLVEALVVEAVALRVSTETSRCSSASPAASASARSASPPSGPGRTSGCRCRGRPSCARGRDPRLRDARVAGAPARRLDRRAPVHRPGPERVPAAPAARARRRR